MNLGVLDLGSNSFHLLVARVRGPNELVKLGSQKEVLGLGTVVQERGELTPAAFEKALASVCRLVSAAREMGAEALVVVGTSALREARNGGMFVDACREVRVDVRVLTGDEEARFSYLGASSANGFAWGRVLLADLGGGSVELAAGQGPRCDSVLTLPLGFLRLARQFPASEGSQMQRIADYVEAQCQTARAQLGRFDTLQLAGGSARALGKLLRGGEPRVRGPHEVLSLCKKVASMSPHALVELGVDPLANTLPVGAAVISGLLTGLVSPAVRISSRGLRGGCSPRVSRPLARRRRPHPISRLWPSIPARRFLFGISLTRPRPVAPPL